MTKAQALTHKRVYFKTLELEKKGPGVNVIRPRTGYHLVDVSPWPFVASFGALRLVRGLLRWIHGRIFTLELASVSLVLLGLTMVA